MKVRTSNIIQILKGDLNALIYLKELKIEANQNLKFLEPGLFSEIAQLEQLSISFNTGLKSLQQGTFDGLINLRNLSLVNNGFTNIANLASLLKPNTLPSLKGLDISENRFKNILKNDFIPMTGSLLSRLEINLCDLEYVHPDSFLPLKMLKDLYIGQNNLNTTLLSNVLTSMYVNGISLTFLDLSGMGFRKQPPRDLMETIAMTTISRLILADNHFEGVCDDTFPTMTNIRELDLRRVFALTFGANAFDTTKFPNLQVLLLSGNKLHGLYQVNKPSQSLLVLDLSHNGDFISDKYYYNIVKNTFLNFRKLRVLYLAYNPIRSIFDYTFIGLEDLRILNLDNSSIFFVGEGTFKPLKRLELLNLANNPFGQVMNLTGSIFEGLGQLKVLLLKNCRINYFGESNNVFEKMPNITTLILRKNLLRYITAEMLKPLTKLQILDLGDNMLGAWWKPLFLTYGVRPTTISMENNKITHFTLNMLLDINYLLDNRTNVSMVINFTNNVFVCDCNSMYQTYAWLKVNGSRQIKKFFHNSSFLCNSPDTWDDKRVALFLDAVSTVRCSVYIKTSNLVYLVWSAPTLVSIILVMLLATVIYKYRVYITYWIFLSKVALGRKFIRKSVKADAARQEDYRYDAFVSYSNEDKDFVTTMINKLELNPPHLRLCIFERDFEIGSMIAESVTTSINESRYIILVISNNFAKSQWCRWETHLAEYHRLFLEDGTSYDPLVLIKIGEIEKKYLTITLKYLLRSKIYHSWNDHQSEEFWMKLKKVLMKK